MDTNERTYVERVTRLAAALSRYCPECDLEGDAIDPDSHTLTARGEVVVGCEGYWVVNPALVGIDSPGWSDATGREPVELPVAPEPCAECGNPTRVTDYGLRVHIGTGHDHEPPELGGVALEAVCDRCGELFNPADLDDLDHVADGSGRPCGGRAVPASVGTWR